MNQLTQHRHKTDGSEGVEQPYRSPPQPYPAQKARQGVIILDTPAKRAIFVAGLVGVVLLAIVLAYTAI